MNSIPKKVKVYEFKDLLEVVDFSGSSYDVPKIQSAYDLAKTAHADQKRKSGDPYISHPIAVATILADLGMDTDSIVAALLHDVVEDTTITIETVRKTYGDDVALLVAGVTKLGKIPFSSREEQQAENLRKMLIAMARDVRVIIIKLADRLHNMRTLNFMVDQKQRDISLETMEVYAPIAHRLGIRAIKEELEDLALHYLDPVACVEIDNLINANLENRNEFMESLKSRISQRLVVDHKNYFIDGRIKNTYGIYRKIYMQSRAFAEIYDIYAVRIIVGSVIECYNILGEIHDMFRPIPNRFKDYISTPKPNMYQSLHTTVVDKEAIPFEVQIRTWDMHHTAEYGIAAHWKYKEGISGKDTLEDKITWVRQLLESQTDAVDAGDILGSIKTDLSTDEIYVFTPKGDVIALPKGATVIDFAYAIHSEVGNRMVGAKIDARMVSLDTEVHTGMIVNIITTNAKGHGPSRDWINMVKTSSTRNKIKSWFKRERIDENIEQGFHDLDREFKRNNIELEPDELNDFIKRIAKSQHLNSSEEFLAAIGYGGILITKIMPQLRELYQKDYKTTPEQELLKKLEKDQAQRPRRAPSGVIVEGLDNCLTKFSKCCNPLPGDQITGYISRGFGVSIHKTDCINIQNAQADLNQKERIVKCEWSKNTMNETFKSTVDLFGYERDGLLVDVSIALNSLRVPIYALTAKEQPNDQTSIQITFGISSLDQLRHIISSLCKIKGVSKVERTIQ